jgi:hypothetical protein
MWLKTRKTSVMMTKKKTSLWQKEPRTKVRLRKLRKLSLPKRSPISYNKDSKTKRKSKISTYKTKSSMKSLSKMASILTLTQMKMKSIRRISLRQKPIKLFTRIVSTRK